MYTGESLQTLPSTIMCLGEQITNKLELTMGDSISLSMKNNDVVKTINYGIPPSSFNKIRMMRTTTKFLLDG